MYYLEEGATMSKIPKIQIRGNVYIVLLIVVISIVSIYGANELAQKHTEQREVVKQDIADKQNINIESLQNQESSLKKKNDDLNEEVNKQKKEAVTRFDKDIFRTSLSMFATINNLSLDIADQPSASDSDGFYTVKYDISLRGPMYGILNFFNLVDGMGSQYSVDYFSFRQAGGYKYLERATDIEDPLAWAEAPITHINPSELQKVLDASKRLENNSYDFGDALISTQPDTVTDPLIDNTIIDNPFKQEVDPEQKKADATRQAELKAQKDKAMAEKAADAKLVEEFLAKYYPTGTVIKDGKIIVPMLDGEMILDTSITFSGNIAGAEPIPNINQYLIPAEVITSEDRNVEIRWNGETRYIPSIIQGVDVTDLNGLIINNDTAFTVSWNNELIPKDVIESFLSEKEGGVSAELQKVASEIRFIQHYNPLREEIELKEYLIFLYEYQQEQGGI